MWFVFRTARYAAYAGGGRRGRKAPKKEAGTGGKLFGALVTLFLVVVCAIHWPAVTWSVIGGLVFMTVLAVAVTSASTQPARPGAPEPATPRRDPLAEAMKDYGKGGKS